MKKLKSIKFYNFITITSRITLNVNFFDEYGKLIVMDFSNYLSLTTTTKCETDKYLITASSSYDTFGKFCKWANIKNIKPIFCETDKKYI